MTLYGFRLKHGEDTENVLINIYYNNFYRNISLGFILLSLNLNLVSTRSITACIDYNRNIVTINYIDKTLIYPIEKVYKIEKSLLNFYDNLIKMDFGKSILEYSGYLNKNLFFKYISETN